MAHPATHCLHNVYPATPFVDSITLPYCTYNVTFPAAHRIARSDAWPGQSGAVADLAIRSERVWTSFWTKSPCGTIIHRRISEYSYGSFHRVTALRTLPL